MSKSAKVQEPSMEEILASIRRIIADEGNGPVGVPSGGAKRDRTNASAAASTSTAPEPNQQADGDMQQTRSHQPATDEPSAGVPDVLELRRPVEQGPTGFKAVRGPDVVFREGEGEDEQPKPTQQPSSTAAAGPTPAAMQASAMRDSDILSPATTATVSAAFGSLANTILSENARTLEDLVKEMMRPMLKEWLDENLPGLVERLVRAEIERVSRGGR